MSISALIADDEASAAVADYFLAKALFVFINIEARRNKWHVPAGVSGLFS